MSWLPRGFSSPAADARCPADRRRGAAHPGHGRRRRWRRNDSSSPTDSGNPRNAHAADRRRSPGCCRAASSPFHTGLSCAPAFVAGCPAGGLLFSQDGPVVGSANRATRGSTSSPQRNPARSIPPSGSLARGIHPFPPYPGSQAPLVPKLQLGDLAAIPVDLSQRLWIDPGSPPTRLSFSSF